MDRGAASSHSATVARHWASRTPAPVERLEKSEAFGQPGGGEPGWIAALEVGQLVGQHGALLPRIEVDQGRPGNGDFAAAERDGAGQFRAGGEPDNAGYSRLDAPFVEHAGERAVEDRGAAGDPPGGRPARR